jgi:hypothetical protein
MKPDAHEISLFHGRSPRTAALVQTSECALIRQWHLDEWHGLRRKKAAQRPKPASLSVDEEILLSSLYFEPDAQLLHPLSSR